MEFYKDFTVCKNCGATCYLNNFYCEDCANELFEAECGINSQLIEENEILEKALKLACQEADNLLIKHEGWRFGLASENNFDKYFELEKKGLEIQGHCDYFKQQAGKEMNNGN